MSEIGLNGKIYNAILSLYLNPRSRVVLNGFETEYFACPVGVKQGDCLSPTLFAIFINDLATQVKETGLGIKLDCGRDQLLPLVVGILLYADDIVCLAENEDDLQFMLYLIEKWCEKWRLDVNMSKTNIMHVRNKRRQQSKFTFFFSRQPVQYCKSYKYLGVNIDEHLSFKFSVDKHSDAAERALSGVITKMIKNGGFPYSVYSTLYRSCVLSVSDYSSAVTGFEEYSSSVKLQLRAIRAFLGLPKSAPNYGVLSECDWLIPKFRTRIIMVRYYHRLLNLDESRVAKGVFLWDKQLNEQNIISTWYNEVKTIFNECDLDLLFDMGLNFDKKFTVSYIESKYVAYQSRILSEECNLLPKLRTFVLFKDFQNPASYIGKPLNFYSRRQMAKLRLGCLPLRLETGRYAVPRVPEHQRICLVNQECTSHGEVESESYFLFFCKAYQNERDKWFNPITVGVFDLR